MTSFTLKILACLFMLVDHIGFEFFPKLSILRVIGRLAFPIFAFQISIGYEHTKSKEKYLLRMLLFTLISQIPYYLFNQPILGNDSIKLNVGATFTVALLTLYSWEKIKNPIARILIASIAFSLSIWIPMDYGWYGVLCVLLFYFAQKRHMIMGIGYLYLLLFYCYIRQSIFNLPAIFALLPIMLFNGKKGKEWKGFFYIFYPSHLLLLAFIYQMLYG